MLQRPPLISWQFFSSLKQLILGMIMMHLSKKISKAVDVGHDHDVPEYNFSKAVDVGHDASTMSRI